MLELIKYIVGHFVDDPDAVDYAVEENGNNVEVTILLESGDMGKVIGRQGKIAKALRAIVKAAAAKTGKKYTIEIKGKDEQ
ncbi:MAG: KH domain-containing protein [Clostridia bacterium]|nr:KH domain-containing protein [Clostridia bacterium]